MIRTMLNKKNILIIAILVTLGSVAHLMNFYANYSSTATIYIEFDTQDIQTLELKLYDKKAPETVKNFKKYAQSGFYNETIFHRIIPNFMAQGGGYTETLTIKPTQAPIKNEANADLANKYGTIAMARTNAPHSATSQFFINLSNNSFLNHRNKTSNGYGYAVFGKISSKSKNKDILNRLNETQTKPVTPHQNVPINPIKIQKIIIKKPQVLF